MKIELTLLLIDNEVTGLELGDFCLSNFGNTISSAGHYPSQSMMVFIFISNLLDELILLRRAKTNSRCVVIAADSSFALYLEKKGKTLCIKNSGAAMSVPFEKFSGILYASVKSWLLIWQPRISPEDGALCDLLKSMSRFRSVFEY